MHNRMINRDALRGEGVEDFISIEDCFPIRNKH